MSDQQNSQQLVDMMEAVWSSIGELCQGFSEGQWKTATDCPNWSVQDQLSHLVGSESRISGRPAPEHTPAETGHVRNEIGARNEEQVDWRRSWLGTQVLEEFREVTVERLVALRALTPEGFAAETDTPIGPGTFADFLRIRIFDAWVHEQDIRRAVAQPGHMQGPVAHHSIGRTALAMPYVVARRASAPDGSTVVFRVTGEAGQTVSVRVQERRGLRCGRRTRFPHRHPHHGRRDLRLPRLRPLGPIASPHPRQGVHRGRHCPRRGHCGRDEYYGLGQRGEGVEVLRW